jgi:hypothetical protein
MYPHLKMLSPYIFTIYFLSYILNKRIIVILFTPLLWIISIIGVIILLYRRFYKKNIIYSLIIYKLFNIKTDIPLILLKILTIIFLYNQGSNITKESILLTIVVLVLYLYIVDLEEIYLSEM